MAGKTESSKIRIRKSGSWTIYICVFSLIVFLTGCVNQQPITFAENVTPSQKKVELKKRLDRRFNDYEASFLLAQLYHAEKSYDDAEFYYENALRANPVYKPAQAGLVKLFVDRGETVKAQHYFENYLNLAGDIPSKIIELAQAFQDQGVDTFALASLNKALSIAPKSAEVNKALGYYYLKRNDKDKAREYFENSFNIDSKQDDVARELGFLGVPVVYEGKSPVTEENN